MTQHEREENKALVAGIKERLMKEAVVSSPQVSKGGQHVGLPAPVITLTSEEMGFSITIGYSKTKFKNIEMAQLLFDLYIDEIIK